MGFGLIANALAGGLAGGGMAAERAFTRLGEQQSRVDLEQLRAQIEMDRQTALARLGSELRRGEAKYASDLQLEVAGRERERVRGIIEQSTAAESNAGPTTPGMIRQRVRADLAASGDLKAAADYDKATEPDKPTVTTTPLGSISETTDPVTGAVRRVDNNSRGVLNARESSRSREQRPISQEDLFKLSEQASKQADRLVKARPHPFPDPLATDKDANRDLAFQRAAEGIYRETLSDALSSGVTVAPDRIDRLVLAVHDRAKGAIVAEANDLAGKLFDAKGAPLTGADAALAKLGVRAGSRDEFLRAYYDANIERAMGDVITASRRDRTRQDGEPAAGAGRRAETAAQEPTGRNVTDRQREDRGFNPMQTGLIGSAAGEGAPSGPSATAPSRLDELGTALDTAREEYRTARAELERFGLRQQKQDPAGFRAAKERAAKADEAARRAQAAYERAATGERNQVGFSALQRGE